ncbi:MAG: heme NO-binding domain-containing protein [Rhodobacter sp.]|nr:heme NO-binding domain-containing protein [Rhodobacter sp.]
MHGLINRSIECFLRDTYGAEAWVRIAQRSGADETGFEAMLSYEDASTDRLLAGAAAHLEKPRDMLLEDLGTYLVSHSGTQPVRRLLRFGGATFVDFLHSLDELHDRARLAIPDLTMPQLELREHGASAWSLSVVHPQPGFGHVIVGILRAMADDYGALVLLDHAGRKDGVEIIGIELAEMSFAKGRHFELGLRAP